MVVIVAGASTSVRSSWGKGNQQQHNNNNNNKINNGRDTLSSSFLLLLLLFYYYSLHHLQSDGCARRTKLSNQPHHLNHLQQYIFEPKKLMP